MRWVSPQGTPLAFSVLFVRRVTMASRQSDRSSGGSDTWRDVVTLDDLAPRHDVRGGSERRVFGADTNEFATEHGMADKKGKKTKDLARKSTGRVR
jgi:hypothetical protein